MKKKKKRRRRGRRKRKYNSREKNFALNRKGTPF